MTVGETKSLKTYLTVKEVIDAYKKWNYLKPSNFAQKLIVESNWTIFNFDLELSNDDEKELMRLKDVIINRWNKLHSKWRQANYDLERMQPKDPNATFIDLQPDFQMLIDYNAIPIFGGPHTSTHISNTSWIEEAVPVSKMRKDFRDHPKTTLAEIFSFLTPLLPW